MSNLTLGETAQVEAIADLPIDALNDPTAPKAKLAAALIMVVKKRTNPAFTLDDAYAMDSDEAAKVLEDFFTPDQG